MTFKVGLVEPEKLISDATARHTLSVRLYKDDLTPHHLNRDVIIQCGLEALIFATGEIGQISIHRTTSPNDILAVLASFAGTIANQAAPSHNLLLGPKELTSRGRHISGDYNGTRVLSASSMVLPLCLIELPQELADKYRVNGFLGKGSWNIVYEVERIGIPDDLKSRLSDKGSYALAVLAKTDETLANAKGVGKDIEAVMRLQLSNLVVRDLKMLDPDPNSRHIVSVYDVQRVGDIVYAVMENYGKRLTEVYSTELFTDYAPQVVRGIAWLHKNGIIHGDVSESNFGVKNGQLRISDLNFGEEANHLKGIRADISLRARAPEVYQTWKYSFETDVYSLGATLFWMATGHNPFRPKNLKPVRPWEPGRQEYEQLFLDNILEAKRTKFEMQYQALRGTGIPRHFVDPIMKCLQFEISPGGIFVPEGRYNRATELLDDLNLKSR